MSSNLYEITGLERVYDVGVTPVRALDGVHVSLAHGELVAIEGSSGSGKSTMLAVLGGLDRPTSGSVRFEGRDMGSLTDGELTALRARDIGFVFQGFNLIPTLNAVQNVQAVMGPLQLSPAEQRSRALGLLDRVGLAARADHLPTRLSGGEQQRVAIARALANRPRVLLADEPTGNLDTATADGVMELLRGLVDDLGVTVLLVTHDRAIAAKASRRIRMQDGRIVADSAGLPVTAFHAPSPLLDNVVSLPARRSPMAVSLVAQAAAVVALAGAGAVTLMPHSTPASAPCVGTCLQAAGPQARTPVVAAPRPQVRPLVRPRVASAPATPARSVTRTAYRPHPEAIIPSPPAVPVRLPVVTRPKPVVKLPKPVTVPVQVPTPEVPVPTVAPTPGLTWSPVWGWNNNATMMDLIMAGMRNGGR